jgi:arsenate reductase
MKTVIFACVHNAGRSQMAAAFFNRLVDPRKARAISAGTHPGDRVHPEVVAAMQEQGVDLSTARPQRLTPELAAGAYMLITMGCGDECPLVPGAKRDDWPLEDPKGKDVATVRSIRDDVRTRVQRLIAAEQLSNSAAIRAATPPDLARIEAMLKSADLPLDGVQDAFNVGFVAEDGEGIVGAVALEVYSDSALLRSLVVDGSAQGRGLGGRLTQAAIDEAQRRGVRAIYLLTTTADAFFPRFGFVAVDRQSLPASIQGSIEFQSACPASAIAMARRDER